MEKELALQVAAGLGYQLTEAERQRILENQPGSLAAFLAFSQRACSPKAWATSRGPRVSTVKP